MSDGRHQPGSGSLVGMDESLAVMARMEMRCLS